MSWIAFPAQTHLVRPGHTSDRIRTRRGAGCPGGRRGKTCVPLYGCCPRLSQSLIGGTRKYAKKRGFRDKSHKIGTIWRAFHAGRCCLAWKTMIKQARNWLRQREMGCSCRTLNLPATIASAAGAEVSPAPASAKKQAKTLQDGGHQDGLARNNRYICYGRNFYGYNK